MKRKVLIGIALILSFSLAASAWDVLGSAYILERIKGGAANAAGDELYGSTAPDFVNYMLGTPFYSFCYDQTHKDFMRVWHMSNNGNKGTDLQKVALGFVSHNGLWGSDYIAHVASLENPSQGYVITQAIFLEQVYAGAGVWAALQLEDAPYEMKLELCHNIVEYIIDVQVWIEDPALAGRVAAAAGARDAGFPALVTQAYSKLLADFSQTTVAPMSVGAAAAFIQGYEAAFQALEITYATLYTSASNLTGLMTNLSYYLSGLANQLYQLQTTPAGVEQILWLAFQYLPNAINELKGTAEFVKGQMAAHHIVYGPKGIMSRVGEELAPQGRIKR